MKGYQNRKSLNTCCEQILAAELLGGGGKTQSGKGF